MVNMNNMIIHKLFLVIANNDWSKTFHGEIPVEFDENGDVVQKEVVHGTVIVNDCKVWGMAENEDKLIEYLNDTCTMILGNDYLPDILFEINGKVFPKYSVVKNSKSKSINIIGEKISLN